MEDKLLASHRLAKFTPPLLLLYLLFGSTYSYTFSASNGQVTECSRSVDYLAIVLGGIGLAVGLFLLRLALRPRTPGEETGVLGNRVGAIVVLVLSALLLWKGISAEGATDLVTCSSNT